MDYEMQIRSYINNIPKWKLQLYTEGFDINEMSNKYKHTKNIYDIEREIDLFESVNKDQAMILAIIVWDYVHKNEQ